MVPDARSRRVVGRAMETHLRTEPVLQAPGMAIGRRRPRDAIRHSDQGSRHTAPASGKRRREAGVRPSTGSAGDALDDAMAGSLFAALECELLARRRFASRAEARMAAFTSIEGWCDPSRRHSALGCLSPTDCEKQMNAQA